jgi:hypothetical protein
MGTPIVAIGTRAGEPAMNRFSRAARLREKLPLAPKVESHFTWRGQEVSRLEGLVDAVFAFAVTLLVIALEVPRTTEALRDVLRGFPAFVLCFGILMAFWNAHYRYFRRFGLQNSTTRVVTMGILVLVLFFVYPLKFLFTLVTANTFGLTMHDAPRISAPDDVQFLYTSFGLGFAGIWALYAGLYVVALRRRVELHLSSIEVNFTRGALVSYLIHVGVCLASVVTAYSTDKPLLPGLVYLLLIPMQVLNKWWFTRSVR